MNTPIKVLLSGATGYIGGSVLNEILKSPNASDYSVSALVRHEDQAKKLEEAGVKAILFTGLDDVESCRKAACDHDVVINAAAASHNGAAKAWIQGLGERQRATGITVHYIQTSGSSVLGYEPVLGAPVDTKVWSDATKDFSLYEKYHPQTRSKRVGELALFGYGDSENVRIYVIVPTAVYGEGTGLFGTFSYPNLVKSAIKEGQAIVVGQGNGIWNNVHISDLSKLYKLLLDSIASSNTDLPYGRQGVYWAENGEHTWKATSESIAKALKSQGLIETEEVKSVSLSEGAKLLNDGDEGYTEAIYASNSRGRADLAWQLLGWRPKYDEYYADKAREATVVAKDLSKA